MLWSSSNQGAYANKAIEWEAGPGCLVVALNVVCCETAIRLKLGAKRK